MGGRPSDDLKTIMDNYQFRKLVKELLRRVNPDKGVFSLKLVPVMDAFQRHVYKYAEVVISGMG